MTAKTLICIPATYGPLDLPLVDALTNFGFEGVRVEIHPGESDAAHEIREAQIAGFKRRPELFVIFLIGGGRLDLTRAELVAKSRDIAIKLRRAGYELRGNYAIEIGNEPDLAVKRWKRKPREMGAAFREAFYAVREELSSPPVLAPSVSNLNDRGLDYLGEMALELPEDCAIAFHRYPAGRDFGDAHKGLENRTREIDAIRARAGGRSLWNTETGWAEDNGGYKLREAEVAGRLVLERRFWRQVGPDVKAWALYQLNSADVAPGDKRDARREKTYGIRDARGRWKLGATWLKQESETQ